MITNRVKNLWLLALIAANLYFAIEHGELFNAFVAGMLVWILVERVLPG